MAVPSTTGSEPTDEQRFHLLVSSVTDYAIYMLDSAGIITTWNPGAQRFKGYTRDEVIGRHFSLFYTEEDKAVDLPRRALATAEREGRFEQEGWRVRKDGGRLWAHVIIDAIRGEDGGIIGYAKITRDISVKKAAEDELRRSEERFSLLVKGIKDYAIYMLDPQGHVTNWNAGAESFKGYREHEIVGRHFSTFYTPEDREAGIPARALETARREGRFTTEGWRVRKDGTRFWADVVIDTLRDEEGHLLGFAKITRDVTERRRTQEELEEARKKLVQSQKMEMIGQLTGGVAHDFNNLLAVVLGNLDLLRKGGQRDKRTTRLIENAISAAQRGASLTQRMLAFARRQDLRVQTVEIPALVRGMAEMMERAIGPTVEIRTTFPLMLPPVSVDANQLELTLLNLVLNARDAMGGKGRVTIGAESMAQTAPDGDLPAGDYVRISVTDSGTGMDDETLSRAIEPFFTTKGVGKGTGLGLSMVHGFLTQSGGRLQLRSRLGEGTTADIWLPAAPRMVASPPEQEQLGPRTRPLCILVVDDDPLVLTNTAMMLEDLGHHVLEASSGDQALRILRREPSVEMLITDQVMPGMSGMELIAAARGEFPALPMLLATGFADLAGQAFADVARLSKPFLQNELDRAIGAAVASFEMGTERNVVPLRQRER
jgi:PAS domain S-box-containing protein